MLFICILAMPVYADNAPDTTTPEPVKLEMTIESIEEPKVDENVQQIIPSPSAEPVVEEELTEEIVEDKEVESTPAPTDLDIEQLEQDEMVTEEEIQQQLEVDFEFDAQVMALFPEASDTVLSKQLPEMLTQRAKFQTVSCNGKVYVLGGINSSGIVDTIDEFDYRSGQWQTITTLPYPIRGFAAVADGNMIYISGGYIGGEISSATYSYNISTNTWTKLAYMKETRERHSMVYENGMIYAIGGKNITGTLSSVEKYNFASNTWTILGNMSISRMDFAAVVIAHKIYIMGGFNDNQDGQNGGYTTKCEIYDVQQNQWQSMPSLNDSTAVFSQPSAVVYGDDIHVFWYQSSGTAYVWQSIYHTGENMWDEQTVNTQMSIRYLEPVALEDGICLMGGYENTSVNLGRYLTTVTFLESDYIAPQDVILGGGNIKSKAVYINDAVYMIGGQTISGDSKGIYRYYEDGNIWSRVTSMPEERRGFTVSVYGNKIYIIGGYYKGEFLNTVIAYDVEAKTWTKCADMPKAREKLSSVLVEDKIYVMGGRYESELMNTIYVYSIIDDTWAIKNSNIKGLDLNLETIDGKIYIIGGYNETSPTNSIGMYDPATGIYKYLTNIPTNSVYSRTAVVGDKILIAYQSVYDGSKNIQYKEYIPQENKLIDTQLTIKSSNVWYELCKKGNELWIIGGYNGSNYSRDIRKLYANGAEHTYNTMTITAVSGKKYMIHLYATGISDFSDKTFVIEYNPEYLNINDICAFTANNDTMIGKIQNTDITVSYFNDKEGIIKFQINKDMKFKNMYWYGDVTIISVKSKQSGKSNIKFYLE